MKLFGKLTCLILRKHKRGKFIRLEPGYNIFACPRCGHEKKYKHRPSVVPIQKAEQAT